MELVIIRGAAFSPKETVSSVINPLRLNWNVTSFFDKGTSYFGRTLSSRYRSQTTIIFSFFLPGFKLSDTDNLIIR